MRFHLQIFDCGELLTFEQLSMFFVGLEGGFAASLVVKVDLGSTFTLRIKLLLTFR
jgi:hypothetical protein